MESSPKCTSGVVMVHVRLNLKDTDGLSESQSRRLHGGSSLRSAEGSHSEVELVLADTFE